MLFKTHMNLFFPFQKVSKITESKSEIEKVEVQPLNRLEAHSVVIKPTNLVNKLK